MSKRGAHENLGAVRALLSVRIMESPSSIKWFQVKFELQSLMGLFRKETLPRLAVLKKSETPLSSLHLFLYVFLSGSHSTLP